MAAGLFFCSTTVAAPLEKHPKNVLINPFSKAFQKADARSQNEQGSIIRQFTKMIAYSLDYVHPAWLEAVGAGQRLQELERLNRHINSIPYRKEYRDIWWPPDMLLLTGGDCEDFAIAKYATLRKAGFRPKDLIILIGQLIKSGKTHAILGVRSPSLGPGLFTLDKNEEIPTPLTQQTNIHFIAGLNETGWWQYNTKDLKGRTVTLRPRFEDRFCDD